MHATLTVPERAGMKFDAQLVDTDQSISPASGTMLVQLAVDNKQGLLFPGEYTEVHLAMPGDSHALFVPASALIFRAHGMQVAVADGHQHVQLRDVTIGTDLGTRVEITAGLHAGERVIDNPPDSLSAGDLVRVAAANPRSAQATQTAAVHDAERAHG
jgi:multidrug efflux pump subunit AcrA (membrane-fusion protein)